MKRESPGTKPVGRASGGAAVPVGHVSGITAVVDDPARAAERFARCFDLPTEDRAVWVGGVRLAFQPRGAPGSETERTGVFALDLAVDGGAAGQTGGRLPGLPPGLRIDVVPVSSASTPLRASDRPPSASSAGSRTSDSLPRAPSPPPRATGPAPGASSVSIDHVGVASADNAAAVEFLCGRLGFPLESQQTDMEYRIPVESFVSDRHGVVHHTRQPELVGGLRVAFVTVGEFELEFLQDLYATDGAAGARGAGTTRGDQSAIARYVATRGPGLHHLALRVPDTDAALERLAAEGLPLIDHLGRPGSRRARIGFVHPRGFGGLLIHVVERPRA
jgi:catechol 2,3-dioxygenase-like lactoylglutathione lyase family enzyme